jgi:hypothetical protein
MPKKIFEYKCSPIFYENVRFLGKTQNFQGRCGRLFHDPNFFLCSKVSEEFKYAKKGATKRISKKVLFQATLMTSSLENQCFHQLFFRDSENIMASDCIPRKALLDFFTFF